MTFSSLPRRRAGALRRQQMGAKPPSRWSDADRSDSRSAVDPLATPYRLAAQVTPFVASGSELRALAAGPAPRPTVLRSQAPRARFPRLMTARPITSDRQADTSPTRHTDADRPGSAHRRPKNPPDGACARVQPTRRGEPSVRLSFPAVPPGRSGTWSSRTPDVIGAPVG
jgi:hypothetical protein